VLADRLRIDSPKTGERFFPLTPDLIHVPGDAVPFLQ
jgi:hypothetical protein